MSLFKTVVGLAAVALFACAGVAKADSITLTLSTHSSDETDPAVLDATFVYTVSGTTLTIAVTNDTSGSDIYDISAIYFNLSSNVTTLTYTGVSGGSSDNVGDDGIFGTADDPWQFAAPAEGNPIDGWGNFGASVVDGQGAQGNAIAAGQTYTFSFTINAGLSAADFAEVLSDPQSGGQMGAFAAAKFVSGPDGDSAFGAIIPLPPALPMGIAGLVGVVFLGRRMRATKPRRAA